MKDKQQQYHVGCVTRWGQTVMLLLGREMTPSGEKWLCLILTPGPGWETAFPPGMLTHFRDIDFDERLA